ncbi:MAG: hypothetical protein HKN37_03215 [Rhodothermales bacterium]|nr:hypothetical protein [Rhodothermales bacterium]
MDKNWWGPFSLKEGDAGRWQVGPCTLWIERERYEWRVTHWRAVDPMEELVDVEVPARTELVRPDASVTVSLNRFSVQKTSEDLIIEPVLANRPVIVRPRNALYVEGNESSTLYVSTPVWLRIKIGEHRILTEVPSIRPSDSWFGANTREGELCYSSVTEGRTRVEDIPFRAHRVVTPVSIENDSDEDLRVERVRIPVQYLSLFRDDRGFFWTESMHFVRVKENEIASRRIDRGAPAAASKATTISGPREVRDRSGLVRTFSSLINQIIDV